MGYILPINQTQYSQYAERVNGNPYDPYQFVRAATVKRAENERESFWYTQQQFSNSKNRGDLPVVMKEEIPNEIIEQTYAELTGKGKYINEVI